MSQENTSSKYPRWTEIKARRFTPEQLAKIERSVALESAKLTLQAMRKQLGLSQAAIAKLSGLGQSEVSRIEQREDHMVSTLRRFVKALGGDLELHARFPDGRDVRLVTTLGEADDIQAETATRKSQESLDLAQVSQVSQVSQVVATDRKSRESTSSEKRSRWLEASRLKSSAAESAGTKPASPKRRIRGKLSHGTQVRSR